MKAYRHPATQWNKPMTWKHQWLIFLFKIAGGLSPAAVPPDNYLTPLGNKWQIRPKKSKDFRTTNIADWSARKNTHCYAVETTETVIFRNSFFSKDSHRLEQTRRQHSLCWDIWELISISPVLSSLIRNFFLYTLRSPFSIGVCTRIGHCQYNSSRSMMKHTLLVFFWNPSNCFSSTR